MQRDAGSFFLRDTLGRILGIRDKLDQDASVIPRFTWADKPAATAVPIGTVIRISDFGVGAGLRLVSDGARWAVDGEQDLVRSSESVSAPADTNENALATITIPGTLLGISGGLLVWSQFSYTNSANNKTIRKRFGGIAGTQFFSAVVTTTAYIGADVWLSNRGAANSQIGGAAGLSSFRSAGTSGVSGVTSAVDTSVDTTFVISGQKASAGEDITLQRLRAVVLP